MTPERNEAQASYDPNETRKSKNVAKKVADAWFEPKSFETTALYERLGIRIYKKYLPTTGDLVTRQAWEKIFPAERSRFKVRRDPEILKEREQGTRIIESIHLIAIPLSSIVLAYFLRDSSLAKPIIITTMNIFVNIYPIMLQRYNRIRYNNAIDRLSQHNSNNAGPQ